MWRAARMCLNRGIVRCSDNRARDGRSLACDRKRSCSVSPADRSKDAQRTNERARAAGPVFAITRDFVFGVL